MNKNQAKVIGNLKLHGELSKAQLYEKCSDGYYHNGMKHFGEILSRMVKNGMIERVKKGVYSLPRQKTEFEEGDLFA